jgi:hypothetical protein
LAEKRNSFKLKKFHVTIYLNFFPTSSARYSIKYFEKKLPYVLILSKMTKFRKNSKFQVKTKKFEKVRNFAKEKISLKSVQ